MREYTKVRKLYLEIHNGINKSALEVGRRAQGNNSIAVISGSAHIYDLHKMQTLGKLKDLEKKFNLIYLETGDKTTLHKWAHYKRNSKIIDGVLDEANKAIKESPLVIDKFKIELLE